MSNTLAKLRETTKIVKHILETDSRARNSDSFLYLKVIEHIAESKGINLNGISIPMFLVSMKENGFPPFESVRRTRQKMQHDYPDLRANQAVNDKRLENEMAYREYALGVE